MLTPPPKLTTEAKQPAQSLTLTTTGLRHRLRTPLMLIVAIISVTIIVLAVLTQMSVAAPKAHAVTYARTPVTAALARTAIHKPISNVAVVLAPVKGTATLTWYSTDKSASYLVGATGLMTSRTTVQKVTNRTASFRHLDERMPYLFTITPIHQGAVGPRSTILLRGSIASIRAIAVTATPVAQATSSPTAIPLPTSSATASPTPSTSPTAAAQPSQAPAPQPPAPQPPAPPAPPRTHTVWSCPVDFTEIDGACTRHQAYTYTTRAYTFHTETYTVTVQDPSTVYAADIARSRGTLCPWGGSPNPQGDLCVIQGGTRNETRTRTVQDPVPDGFTDTGTAWSQRNPAPDGYVDDGVQWTRTVPRIATEVPD